MGSLKASYQQVTLVGNWSSVLLGNLESSRGTCLRAIPGQGDREEAGV